MSAQFVQSASEYEPRPSDTRLDMEDILVIPNATKKRSASSQSLKSVATPSEQKWNRDASDINALPFETNEIVDLSQLAVDNPVRSTLPLKAEQSEKVSGLPCRMCELLLIPHFLPSPKILQHHRSRYPPLFMVLFSLREDLWKITPRYVDAVSRHVSFSPMNSRKPKAWTPRDPYHFQPPLQQPEGEAWEIIKGGIAKYDKEMCDAWNGELDTLLTFVSCSLHSKIVTNTKNISIRLVCSLLPRLHSVWTPSEAYLGMLATQQMHCSSQSQHNSPTQARHQPTDHLMTDLLQQNTMST